MTYSSAEEKWILKVQHSLPKDILKSESDIELTLKATDEYEDEAYSTLTIILPKGPRFNNGYYRAKYEKFDDKIVNFQDQLSFASDVDSKNIQIDLDSKCKIS